MRSNGFGEGASLSGASVAIAVLFPPSDIRNTREATVGDYGSEGAYVTRMYSLMEQQHVNLDVDNCKRRSEQVIGIYPVSI